jgi:hypothetical protein
MSFDLVNDLSKYQKKIYSYVRNRIDNYYSSPCYTKLVRRMQKLDTSIDLLANKRSQDSLQNDWLSKIVIPYGHEAYLINRAILNKNFSADPIISFEPINDTTWENAQNAQNTLNQNFKSTQFRDKVSRQIHKHAVRYGCAVVVSFFNNSTKTVKRTTETQLGIGQVQEEQKRQNAVNVVIDNRNYFQNPDIADPDESDFQGFVQRWHLSRLINTAKEMPDLYVKENIKKAITEAKDNAQKSPHYHASKNMDWHRFGVDVEHWYGKLNIEGNEDDETTYYLEIVGDNIIRFQDNPFDYDIKPITIFTMDKRLDFWWSNTPVEKVIPAENFAHITLAMTADSTWKALQSYILYPEGGIDIAAINDRNKNSGFIPVDPEILKEYKNPFYPWQRQEISTGAVQYMMAEAKETMQRVSNKVDLGRQGTSGGLQNDTAYAANMIGSQADSLAMDFLSEMSGGYKQVGRVNHIMLTQFLDDQFVVRSNPKVGATVMHKRNILGDFNFNVESSLTKNTQSELMKHQNAITWIMNLVNTGNPKFQNIDVSKLVKMVLKKFELEGDVDDIMPDQNPQNAQPQQGFNGTLESLPGINPMQIAV